MMQISKSEYMLFLKHPAWLWLKKHDKSKLPEVDEALQVVFDNGKVFEEYADKLFPDAVRIGFSFEDKNYMTMPYRTKQAIDDEVKTILQGRLEAGSITCIFDVLQKVGENEFDLYEVKSSTDVKEDHILDLAFQTVVLENAGLTIRKLFVIHVNKLYIRRGEVDINEITTQTEVTKEVRDQIDQTKENIKNALAFIQSSTPPDFSPRHVGLKALDEWMTIYEILYPQEHPHNIYKLARLNSELIGEFEDLGIKLISDIPDSIKLHPKQQIQIQVTKENKRIVNEEKIREFITHLTYPLYFLDYETFCTVIPPFDGISPYQQVPFQYSVHVIDKPNGILTHKEFLHTKNSNPCLPLLEQLKKDIGDKGTVLVWYEKFEKGRNKELGEMFIEYVPFMSDLNERIVDLMTPFSKDWFADKDFFGSASIKKVLPVLVTELSYKELGIQEGATAQRLWTEAVLEGNREDARAQILKDLKEYCKLDTLAMVEIYKQLLNI